jgi:hypothetical protein
MTGREDTNALLSFFAYDHDTLPGWAATCDSLAMYPFLSLFAVAGHEVPDHEIRHALTLSKIELDLILHGWVRLVGACEVVVLLSCLCCTLTIHSGVCV